MKKLLAILALFPCMIWAQYTVPTFSAGSLGTASQVATPTFSPVAGSYASTQTVTISTSTSLAVLCYTTDGSMPTESSNLCSGGTTATYSTPITVSTTQTVKAIGTLATYTDSSVASALYTICAYQMCDTFTGTNGTNLESHTADSGQSWLQGSTGSCNQKFILNGSHAITTPANCLNFYYANFTPSSANYTVNVSCTLGATSNGYCAALARVTSPSSTTTPFYACRIFNSSGIALYEFYGAGTANQIGTTYTAITGGTHTIGINVNGSTITCYVDGTPLTGTASGTDTTYTGAGNAGIMLNSRGGTAGYSVNQTFTVQ